MIQPQTYRKISEQVADANIKLRSHPCQKTRNVYEESLDNLVRLTNILLQAGSLLPPKVFDRYAPVIIPILQENVYACYDAGNQWTDANFHRYADDLAKGLARAPRLCHKMACDYLEIDQSARYGGIMFEQIIDETLIAGLRKWSPQRLGRVYSDLINAASNDPLFGQDRIHLYLEKLLAKQWEGKDVGGKE